MVKRVGDKKPAPKGGRAAERLAQFELARGGSPDSGGSPGKRKTQATRSGSVGGKAGGGKSDEGKKGRKD